MQVLVNSDDHVGSSQSVSERVQSVVADSVDRYAGRITRIEVHLSDLNAEKGGERDKRCVMEARIGGLAPVVVSHEAPTIREAIDGAAERLERALERTLGRIEDQRARSP